uniref:F-box/LRR-repeat protein 25-like n=1 Tax=Erigeron canadensis TaxID=72917 RepID=UPI001CB89648|nr:F-box/LRR-repeat protein 25-like [Erigeron canadensis]
MEVLEEENQPPKRVKTHEPLDPEEEKEDRISSLPDLILDEILSRLDSTKYAIRTGTLSKRWQHLWLSASSLSFADHHMMKYSPSDYTHIFINNRTLSDFYKCVDETLTQCHHPQFKNLNKFCVRADYDNRFESHVDNWINFATSSNVQKLDLFLDTGNEVALYVLEDDSFFINSHFTHLVLKGCILYYPSGRIAWKNLTHLTIMNSILNQDLMDNILSGSPLLDTLALFDCYGYSWLDITSKTLKNLEFYGYFCQEDENLDHIININAPYITSLSIKGTLLLWKILLRDVSSLVKAELDYIKMGHDETTPKEEKEEMLMRFILRLHHVKELKIGRWCYPTFRRLEAKGLIFPSNLKVVKLSYHVYDSDDSTELDDSSDNDSSVGDS